MHGLYVAHIQCEVVDGTGVGGCLVAFVCFNDYIPQLEECNPLVIMQRGMDDRETQTLVEVDGLFQ